jgi:hypothetical protein
VVENLFQRKMVVLEDVETVVLLQEEDRTDVLVTDLIEQTEDLAVVLEKEDHLVVSEENVEKAKQLKYKIYKPHHFKMMRFFYGEYLFNILKTIK